ncbi:CTSD [Symbiodinium microadriaticum]|nr:CTSD [Symbiodinium microadriaticum]
MVEVEEHEGDAPVGLADKDMLTGDAELPQGVSKADTMNMLLKHCYTWLGNSSDFNGELPPLSFHVAGTAGYQETLVLEPSSYVFMTTAPIAHQVVEHLMGYLPIEVVTVTQEKVCMPAFSPLRYNTLKNGPIWIMGTPLFYSYQVQYDREPERMEIQFLHHPVQPGAKRRWNQPWLANCQRLPALGKPAAEILTQDWDAPIVPHTGVGKTTRIPGYAGHKADAVKVAPVETCVISIRIPEAYLSAVLLSDTWSWLEESHGRSGRQLFGKARIPKKDLTSLLAASGREGVFLDPPRDAVASQIQWLAKGIDEPASAYHERGLRMSPLLALVAQGGRIGARTTRDPTQAIARIWNFPHVPGDWGPEEVKSVLAQAFDAVTLIHNRRTGREFLYRFRGAHKYGDKDVVPLQATVDDGTATPGETTLWAQVAPHRPQGNKQHFLKPAPVPLLPATASPLDGKLVKVVKPPVLDENGKETSPAQNRALHQREVPAGCQIIDIDKDGSCLYRAVAQGLTWLSGKKKTEHCHRDLRARANAHLRRHQAQYVDEWDGIGPSLERHEAESPTKAEGFAKYLDLAEKESAYGPSPASEAGAPNPSSRDRMCSNLLEDSTRPLAHLFARALCGLRHTSPKKLRCNHLASSQAQQPPSLGAKTVWTHAPPGCGTTGPPSTGAADGASDSETHCPEPPLPVEGAARPTRRKPIHYHTTTGPALAKGVFQCEFCPFRVTGKTPEQLKKIRHTHLLRNHEGRGLYKPTLKPQLTGDAFPAFVSLLSCNVARRGAATIEAVASMLRVQNAAVAAFQEVDINRATAPGFAVAWRRQGFQTVLGPVGTQARHRVALVSSLPMQPVQMEMEVESDRVAAGLISLPLGGRTVSVLVASFYGFPSDSPRTNNAFSALMRTITVFGGPFVILGDFNCTQAEGVVATTLCSHAVRAADEAYSFEPPHTNPTNTRRIDYGLTHQDLVATDGHTFRQQELSDHGIVRIDFGGDSFQPSWQRPRFSSFAGPRPETAPAMDFPHGELDSLLMHARVDAAWTLLSDWAETYLGIGRDSCRRSQPWRPEPRELPCGAPTRDGHEPRPLRALRHLGRRLQQLVQEPWNTELGQRLTRSLRHTRAQVPDLPSIDPALPAEACLSKWRQKIQESPTRAITWIKHRVDLDMALQQPPTLEAAMKGTVHPANRVREQGELWTRRWQTPSTEADLPAYRCLLHNLPQHPQVELDLIPTVQELKGAMGKMKSKAPGADDWQASMFLALPVDWWAGFQRLWAAVVTTVLVPSILAAAGSRVIAKRLKSWVVQWNDHRACGAAPGKSVADVHARILQAWNLGARSFIQQDLSAFFDSLSVPVITETLRHLGAPEALTQLISSFYARQLRLFVVDSHTTSFWRHATSPAFSLGAKFQVIRSLIFPALFWAAGVALPEPEELSAIRLSVSHALQAVMTFEAPRVLIGQVLGWTSDPFWMADWASLSALARSLIRPSIGSEEDMLSSLRVARTAGNPAAIQTVRRLGWQLDVANRRLQRRDDRGHIEELTLATDGSSLEGIGSFAFACDRLMAERAFQSGHTLRNRGVDWSLVWIPSHGKRSSWAPPSRVPATMEECRRLNAALQTKRLRNFARAATEARSGQAGSRRSFVPALWRRLVSML